MILKMIENVYKNLGDCTGINILRTKATAMVFFLQKSIIVQIIEHMAICIK